jgi:hypothetical protein
VSDQPPILDYRHSGTPRKHYWWFDLPSLIATVIVGGAVFFGALISVQLSTPFQVYGHPKSTFVTVVQGTLRWLMHGGWTVLIIFPLSVPLIVARQRQGSAPTVRSIRLTIRVATLLLFLLAGTLAMSVAMQYVGLIQSVSTTP